MRLIFKLNKKQKKEVVDFFNSFKCNYDEAYYKEPKFIIGIQIVDDNWYLLWKDERGNLYVNYAYTYDDKLLKMTELVKEAQ